MLYICDNHHIVALSHLSFSMQPYKHCRDVTSPKSRTVYLDVLTMVMLALQVHYNSVYPLGEAPGQHTKNKVLGSKKLGRFMHAFAV